MTQPVKDPVHTVKRAGYTNPLTLDIKVTDPSFVKVFVDDFELDPSDYTISGINSDDGIEITITAAADPDWFPGAENVSAVFDPPISQDYDLSAGGAFGLAYENAADAIVRIILAIKGGLDRTLKVPYGITGNITLPAPIPGASVAWNDTADGFINGPSTTQLGILTPIVPQIVNLSSVSDDIVTVAGYTSELVSVSGAIGSVVAVGNSIGNVNAVAGELADIATLAANIVAVDEVATNMTALLAVPGAAAASASAAEDSAAEAAMSEARVALAGVPVGTILMQNGAVDPGFLRIGEGGSYDRAAYPDLAEWMDNNGTALGLSSGQIAAGALPDWRDYVPRTAGGTLGPAVGAKQADAMQRLTGSYMARAFMGGSAMNYDASGVFAPDYDFGAAVAAVDQAAGNIAPDRIRFDSGNSPGARVSDSETRVKAFGVRWQIKAYGAVVNAGTADLVAIEQAQQQMLRKDAQVLSGAEQEQVRTNIGLELGYPMIHVQDQKANGTSAGAAVATTFQRRTLNTVIINDIAGAVLSADRVTLPAGTYYFEVSAPAYKVDRHALVLRNDTLSTNIVPHGPSEYTVSTQDVQTTARHSGRFTLAAQADIEVRHYTQISQATNGLGVSAGISGRPEIYTDLKIWKLK